MGRWSYETDEDPKRKHHWEHDFAGFVDVGGARVGKCPRYISKEAVQAALETAVPWSPQYWNRDYPKRLYAVVDGIVYRATPTNPGRTYHGFPENPAVLARREFRDLLKRLEKFAQEQGCLERFRQWIQNGVDDRGGVNHG